MFPSRRDGTAAARLPHAGGGGGGGARLEVRDNAHDLIRAGKSLINEKGFKHNNKNRKENLDY